MHARKGWDPDLAIALRLLSLAVLCLPFAASAATPPKFDWPRHVLRAESWWLLNLPNRERLDASALLRLPDGEFWTVNDQSAAVYRLRFLNGTNAVDLERVAEVLSPDQVKAVTRGGRFRLDCEGLARDEQGRIYVSEESRRLILRWQPGSTNLEALDIDWTPVRSFFSGDPNASFEGIAVGGGRIYVANERQAGRIVVVDEASLKVVDHFAVQSSEGGEDAHYSDLCWAEGMLWVLMREVHRVLEVDPATKQVVAEFDFTALEQASATAYGTLFAPGFMEGLAVDAEFIWLLTDNNGFRRRAGRNDMRPTLFRCRRPDRKQDGLAAPVEGR